MALAYGDVCGRSHEQGGCSVTLIEKRFQSLPNYPELTLTGEPTPIPIRLADHIAYSQAQYPDEWRSYLGEGDPKKQFKIISHGKNPDDPNSFEAGYLPKSYIATRPTRQNSTQPSKTFELKVSDQFVEEMSARGWTFAPIMTEQEVFQTQQLNENTLAHTYQTAYAEQETPTPTPTESSISLLPVVIVGIALIGIIFLILRSRK